MDIQLKNVQFVFPPGDKKAIFRISNETGKPVSINSKGLIVFPHKCCEEYFQAGKKYIADCIVLHHDDQCCGLMISNTFMEVPKLLSFLPKKIIHKRFEKFKQENK